MDPRVAFVPVTVDEKQAVFETSIWISATGGGSVPTLTSEEPIRLLVGQCDRKLLSFIGIEKDGKTQPPRVSSFR